MFVSYIQSQPFVKKNTKLKKFSYNGYFLLALLK